MRADHNTLFIDYEYTIFAFLHNRVAFTGINTVCQMRTGQNKFKQLCM